MHKELEVSVISDVHLGTYGCHAMELLRYLRSIKPKILILNGDIIDAWQFKKRYFPRAHLAVIREILKKSLEGTEVYYITGNHDDVLRRFSDFTTGQIHLIDKLVLKINEQKYWFFHGDVFDASIKISPLLAKMGGKGYDCLIWLNRIINNARTKMGKAPMSFSRKIKSSVKKAVKFIDDFEQTAINLALENEFDYVVCGHIHQAQIREVNNNFGRTIYMNSGDWVESLTALEFDGKEWSIYHDMEEETAVIKESELQEEVENLDLASIHQELAVSLTLG